MASDKRPSAVPLRAHLTSIEVVGDLEKKLNIRTDHFLKVYVDGEKVAKSEKKSSVPPPRWEWPEDHQFLLHPSSTIKVVLYRKASLRVGKNVVGQHSGKVIELLENDTTLDLEDETGAGIAPKIKIGLSLAPESENDFKRFMDTVDANVSGLNNTNQVLHAGVLTLGNTLRLMKNIMDIVADAHPILKASWIVMSSVYVAMQEAEGMDDSIRDLAESLREMLGVAKEYPGLLLIEGTTNVTEEIGRTSLKVTSLIYEYTRPSFIRRVLNSQLSDDMKSRIAQCQKSCDDLKQKFDRRINIGTNRQGARTEAVVSEMKGTLKTIKDDAKAKEIYEWLSAPDSSKNYHEAREKHQAETCSWFLDGTRFRELQEKADFLWIKGTAGCGKTVLCSSIIEKIIQLRMEKSSVSYAYFFFDGRDSQKDLQLHDKLIRSLICQLSLQCDGIPTVLADLYGLGYQQPSTRSLQDTLHHIIDGLQMTYIIIDSLDECIEQKKLPLWIDQIVSRKMGNLHMVVASRPEREISDVLQPLDPNCVDLGTETANHDITIYLEQQLLKVKKWDDETRDIIRSTLTTRAEGMFRWVALQLLELKKCPSPRSVMSQLASLPKGLYETYDQILSRIEEQADDTKIFLRWLCFSVRPLTLAEIAETVVVDLDADDGPRYTPAHRYWDPRDVLVRCSGFISESEGEVKLAHFSIKEYLLSEHLRTGAASKFHLTSDELSHTLISQICLAYILHFDALDSIDKDKDLAISFPLAHYAAEHWIFHAQSGGIDRSEPSATLTLAQKLFKPNSATFANWLNISDLDSKYINGERTDVTTGSALYYASLAGLQRVSVYLLDMGADVNAQDGECGTALQAASARGHEQNVKLLLERGAHINTQRGRYCTALQAASMGGHEAIAKLLLEKGADVNILGGRYGTALQAASMGGYEAVVKLLLEKGADANAQGGRYGTALQAAAIGGNEAVVNLLLETGADANTQGGRYGTALQAASLGGYVVIAKQLLEKRADVNIRGGRYGTALQAASMGGHEAIAKQLLEKGADMNAQEGKYGTALQAASARGYETIAKLLLEMGADVNAQAGFYSSALQEASAGGHEAITKLLLMKGADVNAKGEDTALHSKWHQLQDTS
ncbi:hypothetical protein BJ912DRAFT_1067147 [Pholiota molesta]|nr:hypothetical protein BJ912DRAFT_1067147 [Pholiota molesta]